MPLKQIAISLALFSLCIITWGLASSPTEVKRWVVTENSSLRVTGSTNLNNFSCVIQGYNSPDTILIKNLNQYTTLSGSVNLDIYEFNCHNLMMTKELQKTLKAKQYPTLCIEFLSLNAFPQLRIKPAFITGLVQIHLAGKSKLYTINYAVSIDASHIIHLNGHREISFSDFDLKPPKKMGGIVTAKDKLVVEFNLNLKNLG